MPCYFLPAFTGGFHLGTAGCLGADGGTQRGPLPPFVLP